jgi:hypothetical protein
MDLFSQGALSQKLDGTRICKQIRVGHDCCDSFCVLYRLSAAPQIFRVKHIWFLAKKMKKEKIGEKEENRKRDQYYR